MTHRLKSLVSLVIDQAERGELPYLALEHLESGTGALVPDVELPCRNGGDPGVSAVRPGDVLFGKLRPYLAKTLLVREPAYASTELMALRPASAVEARYLAYLVGSRPLIEWATASSDGTKMPRTSWEKLGEFRVDDVPGLAAQRAIADYLDTETARIDALIAKKQRMIEALEHRWGVFVQTRLLQASVLVPFRRVLSRLPEYGAGESGASFQEGWVRYIRITDIDPGGELRTDGALFLAPSTAAPYLLAQGDLLLARSGATVGRSFIYDESDGPAAYAGYLIRFRLNPSLLLPRLAFFWTSTDHYWGQVRAAALQATIENVSAEKYKVFLVPVPPLGIQRQLLDELSSARTKSLQLLGSQVRLLREHRQALITAAVTGELEVPGVAA